MTGTYMHYSVDEDRVLTATMDAPNGRVNVMNEAFLTALVSFVNKLEAEQGFYRGVILTSAKSTFFADGDFEEIVAVNLDNQDAYFDKVESIKANFRKLEKINLPIVAVINGAALGEVYEIGLACNHKIPDYSQKTMIGLPEVTLGLLPGGGIRLTRKLGLKPALTFLLTGQSYVSQEACKQGLIEAVAANNESMFAQAKDWILANPTAVQPRDTPKFQQPGNNTEAMRDFLNAEIKAQIAGSDFASGPRHQLYLNVPLSVQCLI